MNTSKKLITIVLPLLCWALIASCRLVEVEQPKAYVGVHYHGKHYDNTPVWTYINNRLVHHDTVTTNHFFFADSFSVFVPAGDVDFYFRVGDLEKDTTLYIADTLYVGVQILRPPNLIHLNFSKVQFRYRG